MKVALDSNVLLYAALVWKVKADEAKTHRLDPILAALAENAEIVVPSQVLGECYHVMQRYGYERPRCRIIVRDWMEQFQMIPSNNDIFNAALDLATDHNLQFWDALILNAAADAGCTILLSEDMQSGFTWRGVRVVDPFAKKMDVRLKRLLGG